MRNITMKTIVTMKGMTNGGKTSDIVLNGESYDIKQRLLLYKKK